MTLTPADIATLLAQYRLRPSKALGQHFVADPNTVRRIVRLAGVEEGSKVVEIGAGLGSLTLALARAGARVVAVEIDRHLVPVLRSVLVDNPDVEVVHDDALRLDFDRILGGGGWRVVANLPYNVATPLVLRVLEEVPAVSSLLVMVQREVGERLAATPGSPAYGAVSVKVAYWATASVVGLVPPTVFVPRPSVESALVRVDRREVPALGADVPYARLREVLAAGFGQRRKMLRRSLAGVVSPGAFDATGIPATARAEELDVRHWGLLAAWRETAGAAGAAP